MTREHKLALIVGFSLVLLVGVLISDHLSRARQAKVAPMQPAEMQAARTDIVDPLRQDVDGGRLREPAPIQITQEPPPPLPPSPSGPSPSPTVASLQPPLPRGEAGLDAIEAAILSANGTIAEGRDGIAEFTLPPAAGTRVTATTTVGGVPAGGPTSPLPADVKLYTVQRGDTLSKIAERTYGTSRVWRELAKLNNLPDGTVLLGAQIQLPSREVLTGKPAPAAGAGHVATIAARPPQAAPSTPRPAVRPAPVRREVRYATYTVRNGDTLGHIAQRVLGSSRRTGEIVDLNGLEDEDAITAGTVLKVPAKG
ncbi:MAG: LysM peptidoglycan-binding domain-containing protein [Phycisphaerales bacterium]